MALSTDYVDGDSRSPATALNATNTQVNTNTTDVAARITQTAADVRYVRTVNGVGPDGSGNVTVAGGGSGSVPPAILVVSNDAPAALKATVDGSNILQCDGVNDQVEIQAAVDKAAALNSRDSSQPAGAQQRGKVVLSGGRFIISGSAGVKLRTGVHLQGMGPLSELRASSCTATGMVGLASANEHLTMISDLYFYGNYAPGGACSAVALDMTGGTGTGAYPPSSPDAYHWIRDLFIDGFSGTGTRHGIYFVASSGGINRGNMIRNCQIRNVNGNGVYLSNSSDGFVADCHVGTIGGSAYYISGGNWKIANCKSFYSDVNGFYLSSGRHTIHGCEAQDDATGFYFDGSPVAAAALTADSCLNAGIRVSSNNVQVASFSILNRGGSIRYGTSTRGLWYDTAGFTGLSLYGTVEASNITTPISGSAGSNSTINVNTN